MKPILPIFFLLVFCCGLSFGQGTVEAEFDAAFHYQFKSLHGSLQKKILIDESHNTIYSILDKILIE